MDLLAVRNSDWKRRNNVHLYHLHGGLHWIANDPEPTQFFKARDLDQLRAVGLFDVWADGDVRPARPHVLLTDQKKWRSATEPFASSYRSLQSALADADRVAVLGYSFGDEPLNETLAEVHAGRDPKRQPWLVVGSAGHDDEQQRKRIRKCTSALGCAANDIKFSWAGLPGVVEEQADFWTA